MQVPGGTIQLIDQSCHHNLNWDQIISQISLKYRRRVKSQGTSLILSDRYHLISILLGACSLLINSNNMETTKYIWRFGYDETSPIYLDYNMKWKCWSSRK